jgi:hypothetical protein
MFLLRQESQIFSGGMIKISPMSSLGPVVAARGRTGLFVDRADNLTSSPPVSLQTT